MDITLSFKQSSYSFHNYIDIFKRLDGVPGFCSAIKVHREFSLNSEIANSPALCKKLQ